MKIVVNFSGGRSSATNVLEAIRIFGASRVRVVSMDTGAEHPATYEFMKKFNEYIVCKYGVSIVFLRGRFNQELGKGHTYDVINPVSLVPDLGPFKEMCKKYGTPSVASGWCTSRMKEETHDKYCDDVLGKGNYETWLGIRADEPSRYLGVSLYHLLNKCFDLSYYDFQCIYQSVVNDGAVSIRWWFNVIPKDFHDNIFKAARILHDKVKKQNVRYMAEICNDEKEDVLSRWKVMPFDLGIPEWLGNCVFCFKKSDLKLAAAQRDEPELYIEWLGMIDGAKDRPKQQRVSKHVMYRKKRTLQGVIATFDGSTGKEIKARIRGSKMIDTNSCSESCEVFQ